MNAEAICRLVEWGEGDSKGRLRVLGYTKGVMAAVTELQDRTRESESFKDTTYDDAEIRRAIVHTREDMVLLVGLATNVIGQLAVIRRLAWIAVICLVVIGLELSRLMR